MRSRNPVKAMQARRASDRNHVHRAVIEERSEIVLRCPPMFASQAFNFARIGAIYGNQFCAGNRTNRTRVGFTDVSSTDQPDVNGHVLSCP